MLSGQQQSGVSSAAMHTTASFESHNTKISFLQRWNAPQTSCVSHGSTAALPLSTTAVAKSTQLCHYRTRLATHAHHGCYSLRHQCHGDLRGQNILKNMGYVWGTVTPNSHFPMLFCNVFKSRAHKAFALGTRCISPHFSLSERFRKSTKSGCPPFSSRRLCAELRVPKELILRPENSPKKSTRRRRVRMF